MIAATLLLSLASGLMPSGLPTDKTAKSPAEKLFCKMQKKLDESKNLSLRFEAVIDCSFEKGKSKGTIMLAEGNRARIEVETQIKRKNSKVTIITNGKKRVTTGTNEAWAYLPRRTNEQVLSVLKYGGYVSWTRLGWRDGSHGMPVEPFFAVSDFTLGKREKIGRVMAQAVRYKLAVTRGPEFSEIIWIDTNTYLPVKRVYSGTVQGRKYSYTESYWDINSNAETDSRHINPPK